MEITDYSRNLTALQWAKLCGSQSCIKALRKCKQTSSSKKSSLSVSNGDSGKLTKSASDITKLTASSSNNNSPFAKIKGSLSGHKEKDYLGIESIVACVSTPTIPMLIANSGKTSIQIPEPLISPKLRRALKMKPQRKATEIIVPPKIEVISDTGEQVAPNKHVYGASKKNQAAAAK